MAIDERHFTELKESVRHLEVKMDERFANVDVRFLGIDSRFLAIENRLVALESRFNSRFGTQESRIDSGFGALCSKLEAFESKSESKFGEIQSQFDTVLKKLDNHFKWLVGIQFGVLVTVISVLLSR